MQATGGWPGFVHGASTRLEVQVQAIAVGAARQGENFALEVEMVQLAGLDQALGDLLGRFVLGFESVHPAQPDQICHADFDRHAAAIGCAVVAQAWLEAGPGVQPININKGNRHVLRLKETGGEWAWLVGLAPKIGSG